MTQLSTEDAAGTTHASPMFEILRPVAADASTARLGRLAFASGRVMQTPNFVAVASRGVVPHLTPDNVAKHTTVDGVYMALEDFLEKKQPPVWTMSENDRRNLHRFTAFPPERAVVLGPRRFPAVTTPVGNGPHHMSIFTSTGFRNLTVPEFVRSVQILQPDIAIPPADLFHTSTTPASKRLIRMVERTEEWVNEFVKLSDPQGQLKGQNVSIFAPVLPVEYPLQWDYLRNLNEDIRESLSGLAIYDVNLLPDLVNYSNLTSLPRLSFGPAKSPQDLLRQISLGVDVCVVPFVNTASDAGIALTFAFPAPESQQTLPLGIDMWDSDHVTSLRPLAEGCKCYPCTHHHRAFIKHLLNAKEMLGWNLLQIHNHRVLEDFFSGVRDVLKHSPEKFEELGNQFVQTYEPELPQGTGDRPRARGYNFKSIAGQAKINEPSWQAYEQSGGPQPAGSSKELHIELAGDGQTPTESEVANSLQQ